MHSQHVSCSLLRTRIVIMTDFLELPTGNVKLAGNFDVVGLWSVVNLLSKRRTASLTNFALVQNIRLSIIELSFVRLWLLLLLDDLSDFGCHVSRRHTMSADITKLLRSRLFGAFACEETVHLGLGNFFWILRLRCLCAAT